MSPSNTVVSADPATSLMTTVPPTAKLSSSMMAKSLSWTPPSVKRIVADAVSANEQRTRTSRMPWLKMSSSTPLT